MTVKNPSKSTPEGRGVFGWGHPCDRVLHDAHVTEFATAEGPVYLGYAHGSYMQERHSALIHRDAYLRNGHGQSLFMALAAVRNARAFKSAHERFLVEVNQFAKPLEPDRLDQQEQEILDDMASIIKDLAEMLEIAPKDDGAVQLKEILRMDGRKSPAATRRAALRTQVGEFVVNTIARTTSLTGTGVTIAQATSDAAAQLGMNIHTVATYWKEFARSKPPGFLRGVRNAARKAREKREADAATKATGFTSRQFIARETAKKR